jgi:hypothetical protein
MQVCGTATIWSGILILFQNVPQPNNGKMKINEMEKKEIRQTMTEQSNGRRKKYFNIRIYFVLQPTYVSNL